MTTALSKQMEKVPTLETLPSWLISELGSAERGHIRHLAGSERAAAFLARDRVKMILKPATSDEIKVILAKLAIHYWRPDMTDAQRRSQFEDYLEDLAEEPAWALYAASKEIRNNVEVNFFPRPGQLKFICNQHTRRARERLFWLEKLLNPPPPKPKEEWETMTAEERQASYERIKARRRGVTA